MATMVVETGSGSSTANSYCSVNNADTYHEKRLHVSTWTAATDDNKEIALMWATRLVDEQVIWNGVAVGTDQALMWPRNLLYDRNGFAILSTTIPTFLKEATAEFARYLIGEDRTTETNRDLMGFKKIKIDVLAMEVDAYRAKEVMPPSVWTMIRPYCKKIGKHKTLVRV
jgi:hypothetical protein